MGKRLVVVSRPLHGLGNRVRLVLSGLALAESTGRRFDYYWPVGPNFGARMTDLWEFRPSLSPLQELVLRVRSPLADPQELASHTSRRIWHVRSGSTLPLPEDALDWHRLLAELSLNPTLAQLVRETHAAQFGQRPYVGVMVRAHANAHSLTKQHSPISWYVDRMRELQAQLGDVGFFISADTRQAADRLRAAFPGAYAADKSGSYNSRLALQESVVDLYLLACSTHILGPHHSSFPELAYFLALGQVPLETSVGESFARVRPPVSLSIAPNPVRPRQRVPVDSFTS
ncbi:hypothetical protein [Micropruina sonneratiae]|uniref:hypothetical protein n=1 Tax=Micropruina sonneratiae TaxID=2986940 RepID=UPI002226525D|nr:hypothetical protein [Micropruina sp. KQZ13P-5]MCW3158740.1 hypothetical protein [Micropruina sp. KQZ13P-5]